MTRFVYACVKFSTPIHRFGAAPTFPKHLAKLFLYFIYHAISSSAVKRTSVIISPVQVCLRFDFKCYYTVSVIKITRPKSCTVKNIGKKKITLTVTRANIVDESTCRCSISNHSVVQYTYLFIDCVNINE